MLVSETLSEFIIEETSEELMPLDKRNKRTGKIWVWLDVDLIDLDNVNFVKENRENSAPFIRVAHFSGWGDS